MAQARMGRPPVPGVPRTTVKLGPSDRALLEAMAREEKRPMSETVADALRLHAKVNHTNLLVRQTEASTAA